MMTRYFIIETSCLPHSLDPRGRATKGTRLLVVIHPNERLLQRALYRVTPDLSLRGQRLFGWSAASTARSCSKWFAQIHLAHGLTMGDVVHECVHVAMDKTRNIAKAKREEAIAVVMEDLVERVIVELHRYKIPVAIEVRRTNPPPNRKESLHA